MTTKARSELGLQLALAIPLAAQQLGFQLMGTVDAALLGHHSRVSLAAAGVGNNLLFAISAVGMGLVMGADSIIPKAVGAGRLDDARRTLAAAMRIALVAGLVLSLLCAASPYLLRVTGTEPEVASEAITYVQLRTLGVLPHVLSVALRSYLAARDITRPLVIAVIAGNLANAALDVVFIFGVDAIGLPPLGIVGAAIATVSVQVVILVLYALAVRSLDQGLLPVRPTRSDARAVLRYGAPVAGQLFAEIGIFGVATVTAAYLGTIPAAAHSIALNLSSFTFSITLGIGAATSVRVGQALGAGDVPLARRRGLSGLALGGGVMTACALGFILVPSVVAGLFSDDAAVIDATVPLLFIAALFQLFDGTQAIAAGALRGIGLTRATFIGNLVGHYAIGLPISLVLVFHLGLGAPGLWWGLSAGLVGTSIYLVVRFLRGTRAT